MRANQESLIKIRPVVFTTLGCFLYVSVDLPHDRTAPPVAMNFARFREILDL